MIPTLPADRNHTVNPIDPTLVQTPPPEAHRSDTEVIAKPPSRRSHVRFTVGALLITVGFALPLWSLFRLALKSEIHSHILLIPFIFIYLWRTSAPSLPVARSPKSSPLAPAVAGFLGLIAIAAYWFLGTTGRIAPSDALSLSTTAFLLFLLTLALATLGWPALRPRLFALCFTLFFIPLPEIAINALSIGLQKASADAADVMISLTGMPYLRDGLIFQFSTLAVRVAEECSGVRSTFVLFITSLLAGHLFLRSGWKKALLAFAIFPIGILRNGFRVTTISWLTVNVDSGIIDGPLHHHGGPVFFLLSLLPLFALLWLLRRSDWPGKTTLNRNIT